MIIKKQIQQKKLNLYFLSTLILVSFLFSCKTETVDIALEKKKAIEEYIAKEEKNRQQKLDVIEKFYGVFSTGDFSILPEILASNYTQFPADPG
ncbi:hypothetical protein [Tenacibaculum sp. MAR_2009_124]|uniref:hypothetical protein n=1 Tax=Tenacibaculum sp. MAR_2009_124 TaxID=1250059 RepID=UPI000B860213|nr:hypothetical protein [Tenacibaculum sp. MAR_2009_124]